MPLGSLRFRARAAMTARQRRQAWGTRRPCMNLWRPWPHRPSTPCPGCRGWTGTQWWRPSAPERFGPSPDRPIGRLIRTLERHGVWVLAIPGPLPRRDACSAWAGGDDSHPVIVVAAAAGDRRRFSVAHELGIWSCTRSPRDPRTRWSGRRTRSPRPSSCPQGRCAGRSCPRSPSPPWRSSRPAGGVAPGPDPARPTLELTSPSQYRSLSAQLGARGWRTREPVAVPVERPRALRQLAELLYGIPIDYSSLAHATSLDPAFVRELLEAHAVGN